MKNLNLHTDYLLGGPLGRVQQPFAFSRPHSTPLSLHFRSSSLSPNNTLVVDRSTSIDRSCWTSLSTSQTLLAPAVIQSIDISIVIMSDTRLSTPTSFPRFLDLPIELRKDVYTLVLNLGSITISMPRASPPPHLLRASKQIYHEAIPLLYHIISTGTSWGRFLKVHLLCRDRYAVSQIRTAEIHVKTTKDHGLRPGALHEPSLFLRHCPQLENLTFITGLFRPYVPHQILTTLLHSHAARWPNASINVTVIRTPRPAVDYDKAKAPRQVYNTIREDLPGSIKLQKLTLVMWMSDQELQELLARRRRGNQFVKTGERLEQRPRDPLRLGEVDLLWREVVL